MNHRIAVFASALMLFAVAALANAQAVIPYSNSSQVGFHVTNISTDSKVYVVIGTTGYNITQNYITPNESGETVNGRSYYLNLSAPVLLYGQNMSYIELVKVNYIPRLHTVDFNVYQLQPPPTTSTTSIATTSTVATTSVLPPPTTTTTPSTTTIAQSPGLSGILNQIISLIKSLFSHI